MLNVEREALRVAFSLMPNGALRKVLLMSCFQFLVSTLDIAAIALLGLLTSYGLRYSQGSPVDFPEILVKLTKTTSMDFESQFVTFAAIAFFLFGMKTTISVSGNSKILRYLGHQGAFASNLFLQKLLLARPEYVLTRKTQELLFGATTGVDQLVLTFVGAVTFLLTEILFLFTVALTVVILSPWMGITACLIFGISFVIINKATSKNNVRISSKVSSLNILYNQKFIEYLSVYRELLFRNLDHALAKEIQQVRKESLVLSAKLLFLPILSKYLFEFTIILGGAIVATVQFLLTDAQSALTSLVFFLGAASRILPSLVRAQGFVLTIRQSQGSSEFAVRQVEEVNESLKDVKFNSIRRVHNNNFVGRIDVSKLCFEYSNSDSFKIIDLDLVIPQGSFIAIVGESGSGKSTLIDLFLGIHEPLSGKVEISGVRPLEAAKLWPGEIAYIPQQTTLLDGSIRFNITLDSKDFKSDERVIHSLEKSGLLADVLRMPQKLDEHIGERGGRLSGGQKQRLGIARALFTNPKLICFDEATSALDAITEKTITESIYSHRGESTIIVIAHRLSTIRKADSIIYLDRGKVVAQGTFDELRQKIPNFDLQAKIFNV